MLPTDMTGLLTRQIDLLRRAISDLDRLEQELPSYRRGELTSVMGRLTAALVDDCAALRQLTRDDGLSRAVGYVDDTILGLCDEITSADPQAVIRRDRRLAALTASPQGKHRLADN